MSAEARHPSTAASSWGPLAEPVHVAAAGQDDPPWRDNAYFSFWDFPAQLFGSVHVSTSPNAGGHRARCSVSVGGDIVEIIEELPTDSLTSDSIEYGLDGHTRITHPEIDIDLVTTPRFGPADYSYAEVVPELVPGQPLRHYQQGAEVSGTVTRKGGSYDLRGQGMRDRTWGYRDESAQWVEYAGLIGSFGDFDLTVMKFLGNDGTVSTGGFLQDASGTRRITGFRITRDAAALFVRGVLGLADGSEQVIEVTQREGGFWVPMGSQREGPTFGAYDEFLRFAADGRTGGGFVEQGVMHRVY